MLDINSNEEKKMVFEVDIHGVQEKELQGSVKFLINGVEYGFPAVIDEYKVETLVPPLSKVIGWDIEEGTVVEARLDLHTDEHFFTPWVGKVKITAPRKVSAKLEGEDFMDTKPTIKMKTKSHGVDEPHESTEIRSNVGLTQTLKRLVKNEIAGESKVKITKKPRGGVKPRPTKKSRQQELKEMREFVTEENIYKFMRKHGTKNKKIQEIVYEQAVKAAGGPSDMMLVLKKVMEVMRFKKK